MFHTSRAMYNACIYTQQSASRGLTLNQSTRSIISHIHSYHSAASKMHAYTQNMRTDSKPGWTTGQACKAGPPDLGWQPNSCTSSRCQPQ